jgi:hypothetical protein
MSATLLAAAEPHGLALAGYVARTAPLSGTAASAALALVSAATADATPAAQCGFLPRDGGLDTRKARLSSAAHQDARGRGFG